jgi:hypothetical protein
MKKIILPPHLLPGETNTNSHSRRPGSAGLTEHQKLLLEELNRKMEVLKKLSEQE